MKPEYFIEYIFPTLTIFEGELGLIVSRGTKQTIRIRNSSLENWYLLMLK